MIRMYKQIGTVRGGRRTVRMADRTQRRARLHVEGPHVRGGGKGTRHRRDGQVGQTIGRNTCECPAKRTRFLPAASGGVSSLPQR